MPNEFDTVAANYDENFTFSNIGKAQRKMVFKHLDTIIHETREKLSILELNCGTGEDAIKLVNHGHMVLATDISERMISKARAKSFSKRLEFQIQDINTISDKSFDRKFDLIFSNFGGMNCLSKAELATFLKTSTKLLFPKGKLVMVLMPKRCIWESLYFQFKGDPKKAKRRNTNEMVLSNLEGTSVRTWYYDPREIVSLCESDYLPGAIRPIGLSIPPSYFEGSFLAEFPFLNLFERIDSIFKGPIWARYADHFLIELTKK